MANPGLLLFIFPLIHQRIFRKTKDFRGIWTQMFRVEGKPSDLKTTTTALKNNDFNWFVKVNWKQLSDYSKKWREQKNFFCEFEQTIKPPTGFPLSVIGC